MVIRRSEQRSFYKLRPLSEEIYRQCVKNYDSNRYQWNSELHEPNLSWTHAESMEQYRNTTTPNVTPFAVFMISIECDEVHHIQRHPASEST